MDITTYVADGAVDLTKNYHVLDSSSANVELTLTNPPHGMLMVFSCWDASNTCTVTIGTGDVDGAGGNVLTFDAAEETIVLFAIHGTRFVVVENIGGVAIS